MSRLINTVWECPMCLGQNPVFIKKPTPFSFSVAWHSCESCNSKFQLRFKKMPGNDLRVAYDSLQVTPSDQGVEEFNLRKQKQNESKAIPPETAKQGE